MTGQKVKWRFPTSRLVGGSDQVHIWRAHLDQPESLMTKLVAFLSPDEQARAIRFKFERDKYRFICCRGTLRAILGRYVDVDPVSVKFEYGSQGKPALKAQTSSETLKFNLSHSHDLALYSVAWAREIGIDVEYVRPITDADEIVERYFTPGEYAFYRSLPPDQKPEAFFNSWTLKEAYFKAIGSGLSQPVNTLELPIPRVLSLGLSRFEGVPLNDSSWCLYTLTPDCGYVASIAVESPTARLRFWEWGE